MGASQSKKIRKLYLTKARRTRVISVAMAGLGKVGGKVRAERLSPERRREIATKASRAAAQVRSQEARDRQRPVTDTQSASTAATSPAPARGASRRVAALGALGTIDEFVRKRRPGRSLGEI